MLSLTIGCPSVFTALLDIVNASITHKVFPAQCKLSLITPIPKVSSPSQESDFRPISVQTTLSKIIEKLILAQLTDYFDKHNLLTPYQFGFRKQSSSEHALLAISDFIYQERCNKRITVIVQLDLSKAFDKVNHSLLVKKLEWYGVDSTWFSSYLANRSHITKYNDEHSKCAFPNSGVPQGSILGPVLFTIFINDLPNIVKHCLPILYADDSHLCFSCLPENFDQMHKEINDDLSEVSKWMNRNGMCLNPQKCKFIVIYPKSRKIIRRKLELYIDGQLLLESQQIKSLGVLIDNEATWASHINDICRRVNYRLNTIKQIIPYCTPDNSKISISSLCISLLRYCASIWGAANKKDLNNVDKCVRRCALALCRKNKYDPNLEDITSLGWFVSENMFKYSICLFVYLILHELCPNYFMNYVYYKNSSYSNRFPNHICIPMSIPIIMYSSNLISVVSCRFWNNLPTELTEPNMQLQTFKWKLKNYLLSLQ